MQWTKRAKIKELPKNQLALLSDYDISIKYKMETCYNIYRFFLKIFQNFDGLFKVKFWVFKLLKIRN